MKTHLLKRLVAVLLFAFHLCAWADDTDLFVGAAPAANDLPNVLIVLDNTANWNNAFNNEILALKTVIGSLPVNIDGSAKFRVGFMLFTETGGSNSGMDGGYVRAAVRNLDSDYKTKLVAMLNGFSKLDDKSNGGKLGNTMADAYRYFSGGVPYSGNNKVKSDYAGNISGTASSNAVYALAGNALASKGATAYNSAVPANSCGKNFIIYISNGPAQDNNSDTTAATTALKAAAGGGTAGTTAAAAIPLSPSGSQDNVGDEWARFMRKSSLGVVTYTIEVDRGTTGQAPGWSALLTSMASVSSGKYFSASSSAAGDAILKAMEDIFSEIQSVNSVFAAVSLPVSVNTQGTFRNQVYIGMFRPDQAANPRWAGNMKQYRLAHVDNQLKLVDAYEPTSSTDPYKSAINSNTGFITECARSYWTPSTLDNYWSYRPLGGCLAVTGSDTSNSPDGNIVDKGAQAHKLRGSTARTLKTCSPVFASCTTLTDFNTSNSAISQSILGASSTTERDALINWSHGLDVDNEHTADSVSPTPTSAPTTSTVMRPSVHSDVVHSRPVAINFGSETAPKVVVFYGGNDGILRAVNGNRDTTDTLNGNIGSVVPGNELWAFMAPEFYQNIKRIRDNSIKINYPGNAITSHTPLRKPYGIDGPIAAFKDDSRAWIYATMRRGGRVLYAFNVDVNNPSNITVKWKKGCPALAGDTGCINDTSGDFSGMGQTWSSPKIFTADGYYVTGNIATKKPLLIMGGGYDACEDADPNTCTSTSKGKHVYVLDADTGAMLKTFDTDRSVIADVFIVPDASGKAKHGYAVDLGGNVYRINIGSAAPADWSMIKIASLGCDTTTACSANRKFMFAPDVIENQGVYSLLIGSGDREKPLAFYASASSVANHFFKFEDKPTVASWLTEEQTNGNCGLPLICKASLYGITTNNTPTAEQLATKKGWYLALRSTEQVVTSAITIFDVVNFSTHQPAVNVLGACTSSLGNASVYNIVYKDAKSANGTSERYSLISGGGLPPSPVAGNVTLDNGKTVSFCIGCNGNSPLEGGEPPAPPSAIQPKARVYWYMQK